jgi:hypothetical protein
MHAHEPVLDEYELMSPLGEGLRACIWKAQNLDTDATAAAKFYRHMRRFEREVAFLKQLLREPVCLYPLY